MPKRERDEALAELSSRIFSSMLEDIILDIALKSHQEIARAKTLCPTCHTYCGDVHVPNPSNAGQPTASSSRQSPKEGDNTHNNDTGQSTPINGNGKSDGNIYFECEICKRSIASNRYAPHLSSCLGLNRRGAARNATTKTKLAAEAGRSVSPYVPSENGYLSDETRAGLKSKTKTSKAKRADEAEFSLNSKKRMASPATSPAKKSKKAKTNNSPSLSHKTIPGTSNPLSLHHTSSQTRVPSRLANTVTGDRESSPDSRFSSPERSTHTPTSTLSAKSPVIPPMPGGVPGQRGRPLKNGTTKAKANGAPPPKRMSPPRPPPPPPVPKVAQPDFLVDVEGDGDETGSSTDTDSS
ncbi:hypothetical protein K474DRAFT_1768022 [Panus rudis PR-1116 ss-1]|nr:hypothetical protein K474DRAFT_1768022 [Panus rudis PR-1116 ss-1]